MTLVTRDFRTKTHGFASADDHGLAVCVMPGTELAFAAEVACRPLALLAYSRGGLRQSTTRRQSFDKSTRTGIGHITMRSNFPDGRTVLLTLLAEGQKATVLQLPAQPTTAAEANAQERIANVVTNSA